MSDKYITTDEWGVHRHEHSKPGRAYEDKPVTCAACISRLDSFMLGWQQTLTERHKLPDNFWKGYTYSWSK